ncbi:MAG: hypothetical protein CVU07_10295, partial [Bacteroidetes bacterium HGW-Bacteroidetes-23]
YFHRPDSHKPGGNGARNFGFEESKGEYVNWFDDDDVMLEDFLKIKVESINPVVNLIICSGYYADEKLQNSTAIDLEIDTFLFKDYVLWRIHVLTPSILFRKSFLKNKNLFSTEISRGQEAELFSRLFFQLETNKYQIINKPLFLYRQHEITKTENSKSYVSGYCKSQSIIAFANLNRAFSIGDEDIKVYYYKGLVGFFFRSLTNKDVEVASFILNKILKKIEKINLINYLEFVILGHTFLIIKRGSYRFEKRWKSFKI